MKKLISVLLWAVASLSLASWAEAADKFVLGVSLSSDTNPFYIGMRKGIETRAKEIGWDVRFVTANEDINAQVNGVQDLVAQKVNGILISPIDAVATGAAYEAAHKAGIPAISIARGAKSQYQTLFVAMDEEQIGRDIGAWIASKAGDKGNVAMIMGPAGASVFQDLAKGFEEEMKKHPGMPIVYRHSASLTREEGLKLTEDILTAHPDIRAIYAANDEQALGAVQAAGSKKPGIIITGMNGVPPAMKSVADGQLDMTVQLSPVAWGRLGVDTMAGYVKGERPKQRVFIKHVLVDKSNVSQIK